MIDLLDSGPTMAGHQRVNLEPVMPDLPTGTVTFLFTDIEGSTKLWEHQAALMQAAFRRQEAILREAIAAYDGYAYKMVGDAFEACHAYFRHPLLSDSLGVKLPCDTRDGDRSTPGRQRFCWSRAGRSARGCVE